MSVGHFDLLLLLLQLFWKCFLAWITRTGGTLAGTSVDEDTSVAENMFVRGGAKVWRGGPQEGGRVTHQSRCRTSNHVCSQFLLFPLQCMEWGGGGYTHQGVFRDLEALYNVKVCGRWQWNMVVLLCQCENFRFSNLTIQADPDCTEFAR